MPTPRPARQRAYPVTGSRVAPVLLVATTVSALSGVLALEEFRSAVR